MKIVRSSHSAVHGRTSTWFAAALVMLLGSFILKGVASAELTARANHDHITIDFFYHGSTVSVSGVSDPDADLVIKISAPEGHQALRKKGKVAGLLWMNVGNLDYEHVPSLYFLTATKKPEDILALEELDRAVIGYPALARHAEVKPVSDEQDKARWFDEFIRYKEASRVYSVSSGNITRSEKDGKHTYYTVFDWPYQASPGDYTVTVYAVRDKKIVETAESHVLVEQVGIVKRLADMARGRGALYGTISILAALGAGFGVGLVFRKGGGSH